MSTFVWCFPLFVGSLGVLKDLQEDPVRDIGGHGKLQPEVYSQVYLRVFWGWKRNNRYGLKFEMNNEVKKRGWWATHSPAK